MVGLHRFASKILPNNNRVSDSLVAYPFALVRQGTLCASVDRSRGLSSKEARWISAVAGGRALFSDGFLVLLGFVYYSERGGDGSQKME